MNSEKIINKNGILHIQEGSLRYVGNMPLLYLKGSSYKRGFQYGTLMRNLIKRGLDLRYYDLFYNMKVPKDVLKKEIQEFVSSNKAEFADDMLDFLRGMTDGTSGKVTFEEIYACNSMIMFLDPGGCSAFTKILSDDTFIYCHQTDFSTKEIYYDNWLTIIEEDETGKRMASNIVVGGVGAQNGMNDRGICVGGASRYPFLPEGHDSIPVPTAPFYDSRLCLQNAGNLEEAINIIPDGTLIASGKERKSAMCEKTMRHEGIMYSENGLLFGTNSFANRNCMEDEGSINGTSYNEVIQCARYRRYADLLHNCNSIDDAVNILRDNIHYYTKIRSWGKIYSPLLNIIGDDNMNFIKNIDKPRGIMPLADRTICNSATLHTMICIPEQKLLYVTSGGTFGAHNEFVGIQLDGEVDDRWNMNAPRIPASPEVEKARNSLKFYREMTAANFKSNSCSNICRKYIAIHPDVPSYGINLALWMQNKEPMEALSIAIELIKQYPGHYDLVRLIPRIRLSLFSKNGDENLLKTNITELRSYITKKEMHHDIFIADVEYLLIKSLASLGNLNESEEIYSDLENYLMAEKYAKNKPQYRIILELARKEIDDKKK